MPDPAVVDAQVIACQAKLAQEMHQAGIDCSGFSPADQRKLRCQRTEFVHGITEGPTGLCVGSSVAGATQAVFETAFSVFNLPDFISKVFVCATKENCGAPRLTPAEQTKVDEARSEVAAEFEQIENLVETELCAKRSGTRACPLPQLTCREWDRVISGQTVYKNLRAYSAKSVSDADGFHKGNLCDRVLEESGRRRSRIRSSAESLVARAIAQLDKRWLCFQTRFLWEEGCGLAGYGIGYGLVALLTSTATKALIKGASEAEAFEKVVGEAKGKSAHALARALEDLKSPVAIDNPNRPSGPIKAFDLTRKADETRAGGWFLGSPEDFENLLKSGSIKQGTYVKITVRIKGKDYEMLAPRIPGGTDSAKGLLNTHRSLIQKYVDMFGENPEVVNAGECLLTATGTIDHCTTMTGTFRDSALSAPYLVDVAEAFGQRRAAHTRAEPYAPPTEEEIPQRQLAAKKLEETPTVPHYRRDEIDEIEKEARAQKGSDPQHASARVEAAVAKKVMNDYPGLYEGFENFNNRARVEYYASDNNSGVSVAFIKKARAAIKEATGERKEAYSRLWEFFLQGGQEGTAAAFAKQRRMNVIALRQPYDNLNLFRDYIADFTRDVLDKP